ncbi:MAG: phosphotransferase [Pseudomarimonas sp.]
MNAQGVTREHILQLIPHQFGMCLLDAVASWDASQIHATTQSHQCLDNPLRRDEQLSALHLCEYGAQAMAVHGGLLAAATGGRARPGLLVSLRNVELHCTRLDDLPQALDVYARALSDSGSSWLYEFWIEHAGVRIGAGRAAVMLQAQEANA